MKRYITILILVLNFISCFSQDSIVWKNMTLTNEYQKVLYSGIENKIVLQSKKLDTSIFVTSKDIKIIKYLDRDYFLIQFGSSLNKDKISLYACKLNKNDTIIIDSAQYNIITKICGYWHPRLGNIAKTSAYKEEILKQTEVTTSPLNDDINIKFGVFSCTIIVVKKTTVERFIEGNQLSKEVINCFKKLEAGDLIILHDVIGEPAPYSSVTQRLSDTIIEVLEK